MQLFLKEFANSLKISKNNFAKPVPASRFTLSQMLKSVKTKKDSQKCLQFKNFVHLCAIKQHTQTKKHNTMNNAQSIKISKRTATITFSFDNEYQLKQIKALAVACGLLNPLRNDLVDADLMCIIVKELRDNCEIENVIHEILENIK